MLTWLLDVAAGWPVPIVLAVVAVLLVVESGTLVGMVLPGTTLLVALGLWTHLAPGALVPAITAAATGTVAGAHLGWWRGRRGTPTATRRVAAALSGWFAGRGPLAATALVASGHWAAAARPVMPRVAGAAGMSYGVAGPVLAVSGTAWAATLVLLGNRVGPAVLEHAGWAPVVLVTALAAGLAIRSQSGRATPGPTRFPLGMSPSGPLAAWQAAHTGPAVSPQRPRPISAR